MRYVLDRLRPGVKYAVQIRSKNEDQVSEWSPIFFVTAPRDDTIPSNVRSVTGVFTSKSFKFTWPAVTTNTDLSIMGDFAGYFIVVTDGTNRFTEVTKNRYFTINPSLYESMLGSGPTVTLYVKALDTSGNRSPNYAEATVTAPDPDDVTGFTSTPGVGSIALNWNVVTNVDISWYDIFSGTTADFTPDISNQIAATAATSFVWNSGSADPVTRYFKIRARSIYGTYSGFTADGDTTISAGSGSGTGSPITVRDEGAVLTTSAAVIDFVGSNVTATESGGTVTVNVGSGGSFTRQDATVTTASLVDSTYEDGNITMAAGYRIYKITADRSCRIRLYSSVAQRTADAGRAIGVDPSGDHGVMLDAVFSAGGTLTMSPLVDGFVDSGTDVPYSIENRSGSTSPVTVTITYLRTE
jgi:hypothetical protein